MKLTSLDKQIILELSNSLKYITSKELASKLNVSKKTVYRHIKIINDYYEYERIVAIKGKGIKWNDRLLIENSNNEKKSLLLETGVKSRRIGVLLNLLINSPKFMKLDNLYEKKYVGESTIDTDITFLRIYLEDRNLKIVRKNYAICVVGEEYNIRKVILQLLIENLEQNDFFINYIGLDKDLKKFVEEQIVIINDTYGKSLSYPYKMIIFYYIFIVIKRCSESKILKEPAGNYDEDSVNKNISHYNQLYSIAEQIINNINLRINKSLGDWETAHLFTHLISSRFIKSTYDKVENTQMKIAADVSSRLVYLVKKDGKYSFNESTLTEEIKEHIEPLLNRIFNQIKINNNILFEIKNVYPKLFNSVKKSAYSVSNEFNLPEISEDEVGFLTTYFAKNLEEINIKAHAIIFCTTGIGTSRLLETRLKKFFPNLIIDKVCSAMEIDPHLLEVFNTDFIISTVFIKDWIGKQPIIKVSVVLTEQDKRRIGEQIEKTIADKVL